MSGTGDFMAAYTSTVRTLKPLGKTDTGTGNAACSEPEQTYKNLHEPSQHLPQGKVSTKTREMNVVPDTKWAPNGNPRKLLTPSTLPWKAPYFLL